MNTIQNILSKPVALRTVSDSKQMLPLLNKNKFFQNLKLKEPDLLEITNFLQYKHITKETVEIRCGDEGSIFYIILNGLVSVWVPVDNEIMV